jgi:protein O-mannosyl-transferase
MARGGQRGTVHEAVRRAGRLCGAREPWWAVLRRSRARRIAQPLLVVVAAAAVYASALRGPFVFDDLQPKGEVELAPEQLRPIHWLTFELNRAISGQETWSYHGFNVLVHIACGLALLALVNRTLMLRPLGLAPSTRRGIALATTLIWVVHPLQTGTVTYISQRSESLAALFYLSFLYAFLRSATAGRRVAWQVAALALLALGMATKETAATAPVLAWVFQSTILGRSPRAVRTNRAFHLALAGAWIVLAWTFIAPPLFTGDTSAGFGLREVTPIAYLRSQPGVILHYLRLVFWPHPLCLDYGWPVATELGQILPQGLVIASLLALTAFGLAARSWAGLVGAWFFLILAPTSSFVPIKDLAFENRMYLPLAAVLVLVVVGARWLLARAGGSRVVLPAATAALVTLLGAVTVRRNEDYGSALRLWRVTSELVPRHARPHVNLAVALLEAGRIEEAIAELDLALELDPRDHAAHLNLGSALLRLGQVEPAVALLERAVHLRAGTKEEWRCRDALGRALFTRGDLEGAEREIRKALELNPRDGSVHLGLANILGSENRTEEAIAHYREAARLDSALQAAHVNLSALLLAHEPTAALEHAREALALPPNSLEEQFNLAQALRALGRLDDALAAFTECIRIAPERPEAYAALARTVCAKADAGLGERREAARLAAEANRLTRFLRPDLLETQAMAEAAAGNHARALELVDAALELPGPARNETFASRLRAQREEYQRQARQ